MEPTTEKMCSVCNTAMVGDVCTKCAMPADAPAPEAPATTEAPAA